MQLEYNMLCFGVAKLQYVNHEKCIEKKLPPSWIRNSTSACEPCALPSCSERWEVLIGLPMLIWLLLTKTKIDRNESEKYFLSYVILYKMKLSGVPRHYIFSSEPQKKMSR